ncbi:Inactive TPR repeat-containing thioredoxin TTL3 [Raphanus sativus]|uniref:Inactive TPR repeat-containing thioredoxin TTL3 n=1 Tax=Raphanus sativus TaxID=3726 RepID=A0A6J0MWU6_RAPSA|nr:inactive TPR repeat-containing thioredoxin TTL3 [Raphanus sativus]KAJ4869872.1 Inactive TPR repeat-containing thioredoxin TTL3 [Raphanus sativus]
MSHSRRLSLEPAIDSTARSFRDSLTLQRGDDFNKPDFRELDLGSPVSTLMPRVSSSSSAAATPTSSSGSSGSVPDKPSVKSHSGEITRSGMPATRNLKPGHRRSSSTGTPLIFSGSSFYSGASHSSGATSAASPSPTVLPAGNICPSGRILKTGMATRTSTRAETLCTGTGNYGHGNVVRSGGGIAGKTNHAAANGETPEELKRSGNDMYRRGRFTEALSLYDRAISLSPENASYRSNRAAALTALRRLGEAVKECLEAVRVDPSYSRAHQRLASLYLRLGEAENARRHLCYSGQCPDQADLQRLQTLEKHLRRCWEARKIGDWRTAIKETDAAIANGADSSPQLVACKAEALLRLNQLEESDFCLSCIPRLDHHHHQSQAKLFGMVAEAYVLCIQGQVDMALGRFENGVVKAERASMLDQTNPELLSVLNNVKTVVKARTRGNELFSSGRYSEASVAYGDGLEHDGSNSVLYCNRAACWYKLGLWEKSVEDCNQALKIHASYIKALLRRAASYGKLGRWEDAVRDYEFVRRELPGDSEVAESLERAKLALSQESKSLGFFNNEVGAVSTLDKFKNSVSLPGVSVFHFKSSSNRKCEEISPYVNTLCLRYPLVHFFMVDVEESLALAKAESIRKVPTFKMYKNGDKVKEMICPSHQFLEDSIKQLL